MVGLVVLQNEGSEDVCLHVGIESENCQTCRFRPLECRECGSKDIYEIEFAGGDSETSPLGFRGIKVVNKE